MLKIQVYETLRSNHLDPIYLCLKLFTSLFHCNCVSFLMAAYKFFW